MDDKTPLTVFPTGGEKTDETGKTDTPIAPVEGGMVWIPRPAENPVLGALHELGLLRTSLGDGSHSLTCPWSHEHRDAITGLTLYIEPGDDRPMGGFGCSHGPCQGRGIRDLLDHLGIERNRARMKGTIRVVAGEMHPVVDAAEWELAQSGQHYQRGGLIVTLITDPASRETLVQELNPHSLVLAMAKSAVWESFDARTQTWRPMDPPTRHATILFRSANYRHLPVLVGLTRHPYLRPDGSLATAAGYDAATGMFGVFNAQEFSIPETPSRAQAEAALAELKSLLAEFSFATGADQTAALASHPHGSHPAQPRCGTHVSCQGTYAGIGEVVSVPVDHRLRHAPERQPYHLSRRE